MNILQVKSQIIDQAKFTYCSLGKTSEKQTKVIEDQGNTHNLMLCKL